MHTGDRAILNMLKLVRARVDALPTDAGVKLSDMYNARSAGFVFPKAGGIETQFAFSSLTSTSSTALSPGRV